MLPSWLRIMLLVLTLTFTPAADAGSAATLPLLEPGLHLGTTFYGSGRIP
ncbi:MAG: hypothetical protein H7X77_04645, partial [Anaerolineae bacterium]|nr:hypothetical protein [Anaerolineae bacterium]